MLSSTRTYTAGRGGLHPCLVALVVLLTLCCAPAGAQFYWSKGFKAVPEAQTNLRDLVYGRTEEAEKERRRTEAADLTLLERERDARGSEMDFLEDFAVLSFRLARDAQAEAAWQELLRRQPDRVPTLLNLSLARHMRGRTAESVALLQRALAVDPNVRAGAEGIRLRMHEFQAMAARDPAYGRDHLMLDELTPVWKGRAKPPRTFAAPVTSPSVDAVAGFVHAFPHLGEGWLALGILLESRGDLDMARQCYQRAVKQGSTQANEVKAHFDLVREHLVSRNPARSAGWGMLMLIGAVVGLLVLRSAVRLGGAMWSDYAESKRAKQEEIDRQVRRERMRMEKERGDE